MEKRKKIFIGAAWPYANGSLHLGHVSSLIGGDILARYFRLKGDDVLCVSGSDSHGTPVVLKAEAEKTSPEQVAKKYHEELKTTFLGGLNFSYDIYTDTTTKTHEETVQEIFLALYKKGYLYPKSQPLPYCPKDKRFLPDRYVEGECPKCHFQNARGDQCDNCGNLLDPEQLVNPRCKICSTRPEWQETEHFFLKLTAFSEKLKKWVAASQGWRTNALNFTTKFIENGLQDRAVTRDIEWGVPIPIKGYENKKIYVWFDAVCGYLSASREFAKLSKNEDLWKDYWQDSDSVHYYVHGKDNILFHTIIWPAILMGSGNLHLPDRIVSSEYFTLEKKQFSTSRNWAVWLPEFLKNFEADTLRYYLVANGPETSDADFAWDEYLERTNKELIGNFGNFVHRTFTLVEKFFPEGIVPPSKIDAGILNHAREKFDLVGKLVEQAKFREGLREVFKLAEEGNRFIAENEPWRKIKRDKAATAGDLWVLTTLINAIAILAEPYLPISCEKILEKLKAGKPQWKFPEKKSYKISAPTPLFKQIEKETIDSQKALLGKSQTD